MYKRQVAGNVDNLDDVRVAFVAAHRDFHTLADNRPFFIDTAAHGGLGSLDEDLRDIVKAFEQRIVEGVACNLP